MFLPMKRRTTFNFAFPRSIFPIRLLPVTQRPFAFTNPDSAGNSIASSPTHKRLPGPLNRVAGFDLINLLGAWKFVASLYRAIWCDEQGSRCVYPECGDFGDHRSGFKSDRSTRYFNLIRRREKIALGVSSLRNAYMRLNVAACPERPLPRSQGRSCAYALERECIRHSRSPLLRVWRWLGSQWLIGRPGWY